MIMRHLRWFGILSAVILVVPIVSAQGGREALFGDVDTVKAAAEEAETELYSPMAHAEAMELYMDAERGFERGSNPDRIREDLAEATEYFNTALETTELAKLTLQDAIVARAAAEAGAAYRDAQRTWEDAEETFERAIAELEDGKLDRARELGDEATELYNAALAEASQ